MILVGSARTDENGNDYGGQAGDQTGHEVETQEWYLHPKGWVLIRPKDKEVAECIAEDVEWACDNEMIGYDQWQANTLYNAAKKVDFDTSKVDTPVETHCAALIRVGTAYAGTKCGIDVLRDCPDFYTGSEVAVLKATGRFDILTDPKYTEHWEWLRRGDILVTKTKGHTVTVLEDGPEAYDEPDPHKDATLYRTTGNVWMRKGPGVSYDKIIAIPKDKFVYVYDIISNWAKCNYEDHNGFVSMKYLAPVDRRYFTTGNVWMRKTPNPLGIGIGVVKKGMFVTGTGKSATFLGTPWYEVISDGKVGWCSSKYLEKC